MTAAKKSKLDTVMEAIEQMTVLELADLVEKLEEKFGVSAAVPMAAPVAAAGGGPAPAEAEEKTEFDVVLSGVGDKKIQVIKVVRALTGLGLREAKELVDGAPSAVKEKITREEANGIKTKLEEVGATVELK